MKKITCLFLAITTSYMCFSQNVGVGTSTPAERLDVNGNINIAGNIKINGIAGQNNQVLITNSQGQTAWAEPGGQYKNVMTFPQSGVWNIPSGITNIMVEAWGGGGGGAVGGGGGAGVYFKILNQTVTPGTSITVTIGTGGTGAAGSSLNAADGGNTTVFFSQNGFTYTAFGGIGGKILGPGGAKTVAGSPTANISYLGGSGGQASKEEYHQLNSTQFARIIHYGSGANSTLLNYGGGNGGFTSFNTTTSLYIKYFSGTNGSAPGAGGGGGEDNSGNFGSNGHAGYVLIWY